MVHGGVREVQPRVFGKSNRDLEYFIFLNSCDVKKRHKSDHPNKHSNIRTCKKSSCRLAIHNSAKETGHT